MMFWALHEDGLAELHVLQDAMDGIGARIFPAVRLINPVTHAILYSRMLLYNLGPASDGVLCDAYLYSRGCSLLVLG